MQKIANKHKRFNEFYNENRIIIAGTRTFSDYEKAKLHLDQLIGHVEKAVIFSGMAKGADQMGERYAKERGFPILTFIPDWDEYGKKAGPIRNQRMVEKASYLIAF